MFVTITYSETTEGLSITITQNKSLMYRIALWVIVVLILPAIILALILLANSKSNIIQIGTTFIVSLILLIFVFKHLRIVYGMEKIFISKKVFTYERSFFGIGKFTQVNTADIKKIKRLGSEEGIEHELTIAGDALNFNTSQNEINYLNQEGNLLLIGGYNIIRFGINLDEEDSAMLINRVNRIVKRY